jgi:hypothetical protein
MMIKVLIPIFLFCSLCASAPPNGYSFGRGGDLNNKVGLSDLHSGGIVETKTTYGLSDLHKSEMNESLLETQSEEPSTLESEDKEEEEEEKADFTIVSEIYNYLGAEISEEDKELLRNVKFNWSGAKQVFAVLRTVPDDNFNGKLLTSYQREALDIYHLFRGEAPDSQAEGQELLDDIVEQWRNQAEGLDSNQNHKSGPIEDRGLTIDEYEDSPEAMASN